jgi:hypothetical protein
MDDQAEPVRPRRPQLGVVLASAGALLACALWALVLVLPYVELPGQSFTLFDGSSPVRTATVAPRILGIVLVAATAVVTLVIRDRRGPWWTTSGALLGLLAFSAYWWSGSREVARADHGVAWYLDGLACALAVVAVVVGALGARDRSEQPRPLSAPYAALGSGLAAVLALGLMGQSRAYLPVFATASDGFSNSPPLDVRIVAVVTAALLVATPVLAALARSRAASTALALGWLALMAPLVTYVVAIREITPGGLHAAFVVGCLVAGLTTVALLTWASVATRPDPPARTAAERRAREDTAPLEL